jgi:predicted ATPase/DNA-binding CsgD family transcriptional regulator
VSLSKYRFTIRECARVTNGWRTSPTRLIGREGDVGELIRLLDEVRLVTLVGAPGCGKTRLSLEVSHRLSDRYPTGVWFVELAPVSGGCLVAPAVAAALGVDDQPLRSAEDGLVDEFSTTDAVVVLDNCEHVLGATRELVGRLLDCCPSLRVVATSRTALRLQGEQVWRVPPLDLGPGVELFRDRAGLSMHPADVQRSDGDVIAEICRRLGGLPLAIELAAAWCRVLTPVELLDRLEPALPLLRSHTRDANPRQRTMEATLDWSYQLLDPSEQVLFERLSVFAGGFDFDAALAVVPGEDVLDALTSLVDSSLVLAEPGPVRMRFRLLEPVRQFAELRLIARGAREATQRHHAEHYLRLAKWSEAELRGDDAGVVLAQLEREEDNFRTAMRWARHQPDDLGLRLCTALAPWWAIRGRANEGRAWIDEMLRRRTGTDDLRLRASGLARASRLAWRQRDYPSTRTLLEESLAIGRTLDDALGVARRLRGLALVAVAEGELDEATQLCEESVSLFRRHGDGYGLSLALAFFGLTLQLAGDTSRAAPYVREARELSRSSGSVTSSLYSLGSLAFGAIAVGDLTSLRAHILEVVDLLRKLGDTYEDPGWLWWTGVALASGEGRYRSALRLAGAAEGAARRDGLHLHDQLRRQVQPWLERARTEMGAVEVDRLAAEGSRLTPDELMTEALREADHISTCPLSFRELEITDLIGQGFTNREIAQQLIISTRTVESHVDHIKAKLGFTRRARIVSWALARSNGDGAHAGENPKNYR